jgi:hypothetical protein
LCDSIESSWIDFNKDDLGVVSETMTKIEVYLELWEYLRHHGFKTIEVIDRAKAWDYRINPNEYSVRETFHHTIQAIFEDTGKWFLGDPTRFIPSKSPSEDLNRAIDRMTSAIQQFSDEYLNSDFTFQWGEKTTIEGAIRQNLLHALGHLSQLRNWVGISRRNESKEPEKTYL